MEKKGIGKPKVAFWRFDGRALFELIVTTVRMQAQNQAGGEESWDAQDNIEPPSCSNSPQYSDLARDIALAGVYVAKGAHDAAFS